MSWLEIGKYVDVSCTIESAVTVELGHSREEDIAAEVQLPPLQEMKHALYLDRLGRLTYNALQGKGHSLTYGTLSDDTLLTSEISCLIAAFAVNVVTSRRTGPDYLLSPENRPSLKLAFQNLQRACCWYPTGHVDDFDPKFTLSVLAESLQPEKLATFSEEDQRMMKQAEKWLSVAAEDEAWQSLMVKVSVPIYASQLPTEALRASSRFVPAEDGTVLTTAEVVLALRDTAAAITDADGLSGKLVGAALAAKRRESQIVAQGRPKKGTSDNDKKTLEKNSNQQTKSRSATKSLQRSGRAATSDLREIHDVDGDEHNHSTTPTGRKRKQGQSAREPDSHTNPAITRCVPREVRELRVAFNTLSSKLDWIVAEIVRNVNDNFVVFGKDSMVLGQLTEVWRLIRSCVSLLTLGLLTISCTSASGYGWSIKVE